MDTRSQHLFFDAVCENEITQSDIEHIKKVIEEKLTVVNRIEHKFHPQGETIVFILSESHFAIHTYPENKYISLDIYICNMDINLNEIVNLISEKIDFKKVDKKIFHRGKIGIEESTDKHLLKSVYLVTIVTAMCSILYELLLAQALSTTMGNTALRYNTTIGLYVAAMGFGALMYSRFAKRDILKNFLGIELSISAVGVMAPILVLIADYVSNLIANTFQISYFSNLIQVPLFTFNHLLIVLIGFISGLELPLLINLGKKFDSSKGNYVLAFDYLGTLLGAIFFPIVILPRFDIFTIAYIVSFLNILAALFLLIKLHSREKKYYVIIGLLLLVWTVAILNAESLNEFIVQRFYFGGKI